MRLASGVGPVVLLVVLGACRGGGGGSWHGGQDDAGSDAHHDVSGDPDGAGDGSPGSDGDADADGDTDGDADTDADADTDGDADTDASPDGDSGPRIRFCQLTCARPADCVTSSPAFDADNYSCEVGVCTYQGCNDDEECAASFLSDAYVCRDSGGARTCLQSCAASSECGASAAFDADNYSCEAGVCRYRGCNDDAECRASFASDAYVCREVDPPETGLPLPEASRNCVLGCESAADCVTASAAFDADNYACESGACRYQGCNDDDECAASFASDAYRCR
jgi:hypothetical protein